MFRILILIKQNTLLCNNSNIDRFDSSFLCQKSPAFSQDLRLIEHIFKYKYYRKSLKINMMSLKQEWV